MSQRSAKLLNIANDIAGQQQSFMAQIKREIADLEAQKLKKQRALHSAGLAHERASKFADILVSGAVCPQCWIKKETVSRLHPRPGTDAYDV